MREGRRPRSAAPRSRSTRTRFQRPAKPFVTSGAHRLTCHDDARFATSKRNSSATHRGCWKRLRTISSSAGGGRRRPRRAAFRSMAMPLITTSRATKPVRRACLSPANPGSDHTTTLRSTPCRIPQARAFRAATSWPCPVPRISPTRCCAHVVDGRPSFEQVPRTRQWRAERSRRSTRPRRASCPSSFIGNGDSGVTNTRFRLATRWSSRASDSSAICGDTCPPSK